MSEEMKARFIDDTPRADRAEQESIAEYEKQREAGWPSFPSDGYDFARELETENNFLRAEVERLRAELAPLRELVGVDSRAASALTDINHWSKMMDKADAADQLRQKLEAVTRERDDFKFMYDRDRAYRELAQEHLDGGRWAGRTHLEGCVTEMLELRQRVQELEAALDRLITYADRNEYSHYETHDEEMTAARAARAKEGE